MSAEGTEEVKTEIKTEIKEEVVIEAPISEEVSTTPEQEIKVETQEVVAEQIIESTDGATAAIVENEDGEQQIYIIQTDSVEGVPVETAEVVVDGNLGVMETVSTLEQLQRGQQLVTETGDVLQVYEEVVLPDGTSARMDGSGEIMNDSTSIKVGKMTMPNVSAQIPNATDPTTGTEFHVCRICNQFVTLESLATHNAQAHGHIRDLTCLDCGKVFKSKRSLFGHRKEKHSGMLEVHTCPECGKSFGRKSNLKAHRESLHYGKKFPCIHCDRIFTNRSSMNQHIKKTHSGVPTPVAVETQQIILHPSTTVINL